MLTPATVELNPQYNVNGVPRPLAALRFLKHVDEICVVENGAVPELGIVVNGRMIGLVDPYDEWEMTSAFDQGSTIERIRKLKPLVIFKYQWRRNCNYPIGTVSAGLPCFQELVCPGDLLTRPRPIDVTARMRGIGDYHWAVAKDEWMIARAHLVVQGEILGRQGYCTKRGFVEIDHYASELWNAQIGFDWRGAGYLTHRLIEYIRAGVVPITRPMGEEFPLRDDVILEDGIHYVSCSDPGQFANEARRLLADPSKIERMRRNLIELWQRKLCPRAQGHWIWEKLKAALLEKPSDNFGLTEEL
jgi:hypothetical protein